eukprot:TRINITY_DN60830_c0_g1_i1.p1 TRINITY_DN60830_c0_g1~~TRINITY_DN60830_c0_g1_i1.p1  ORF type:complete len:110 (-),score=40.68 TRINITY_DN60830_c0_g1_i1:295-624(-)
MLRSLVGSEMCIRDRKKKKKKKKKKSSSSSSSASPPASASGLGMMQSLKVTGDGFLLSPKSPTQKQLKKARKLWKKYDQEMSNPNTPSPRTLQAWYNQRNAPADNFKLE